MKRTSNAITGIYISEIFVLLEIHSQNQGCNMAWIVMFIGFKYTKVTNICKLLSVSLCYLINLSLFCREIYPSPIFFENKQNSNPYPLCKVREIQQWLIKTICFNNLLFQVKPLLRKKSNFNFGNVSFTKLQKKVNSSTCYW